MDGLGRYRTTENGLPVDSSGELVDTDVDGPFHGVVELSQRLAGSVEFKTCFSQQFFRFAESRTPEASEQCVVRNLTDGFVQGGGRIQDLVVAYVTSPEFALRKEDR
jgi:hypothetical protein